MIRGLIYAVVSWIVVALAAAIIVPNVITSPNMGKIARTTGQLSFFFVAIPAFAIGFWQSRKDRKQKANERPQTGPH